MKTVSTTLIVSLLLLHCQPVPITGRRQLALVPERQLLALSFEQYQQFLNTHTVITGTQSATMVKSVGNDIRDAVQRYFKERPGALEQYRWEFNLVTDSSVNAWAMPGGKVAVYSGILPVTRDKTGMAVVLGHEIAHVIAEHGNERMSQLLVAQLGGMALQQALGSQPERTRQLALTAFGIGTQIGVLLPYSRLHETEADRLGLVFMAMAGYDPREAVDFWQRMTAAQEGPQPPEFLSTHPSGETRIENIKKMLPEALKCYKP